MKLTKDQLIEIPIVDLGDIYLRAIEYRDYKDMFEYGSDIRVTNTLSWSFATIEEAEDSIKKIFLSRPDNGVPSAYAIINKRDNKMIGTCDYYTIDWEQSIGEIGYVLNFDYWGLGYMTKACKALIDFGFNYLGLNKIVISHEINNIGSQKVIEKSGFMFLETKLHQRVQTMCHFYEINKVDYHQ